MRNYVFIKSSGNLERVKVNILISVVFSAFCCFAVFSVVCFPSSALAKDKTGTFTMAGDKCSPGSANVPGSVASARFNENGDCIVKKCNKKFVLIDGICWPQEELDDKKADACNKSGGKWGVLGDGWKYLGCVCNSDSYVIEENCDGIIRPDCVKKCKVYDKNDCDSEETIRQHVIKKNLDSFKKCMIDNRQKYQDLKTRQENNRQIDLYRTILSTAFGGDFSYIDFLIDKNLITPEDFVDSDLGTGQNNWVSQDLVARGTLIGDLLQTAKYEVNYNYESCKQRNYKTLRHLVEEKQIINLNKRYLFSYGIWAGSAQKVGGGDDTMDNLYAYPLEFLVADMLDKENDCEKDMIEYILSRKPDLSLMDPFGFAYRHIGLNNLSLIKWLHDEKGIRFRPDQKFECYGEETRWAQVDELNTIISNDCKAAGGQNCEFKGSDSDEKIKCCSDASDKVCFVEKENTTASDPSKRDIAHNIVSGVSTAMTSIGMMQAAQGFSEQKSDAAAESDMAAHIATFKCNYDKGPTFKYSTEEIIIPGGDELLKYYTEYKTLADQLKVTKTALNLTPGIEFQVVYDKAESGLYQNFATERTSGHYASVSRALMDSDSEDAAAWAVEKEKSQKRLAIGASVAAGGILTGVIGDKLIDKHYDNPSDDDVTPQEAKTFNECLKDEGNDSLTKSIDDGQTYSTNVYERYLDGPYLGMCKVVDNGDWCTERGSCIINGTSTCSQSYNNEAYGYVATNQNMKHGANDGRYCYCKMTSWTPNGGQQQEKISQWGFLKEYPDATNCARFCARHCGDDLEHRYSDIARYVFKN